MIELQTGDLLLFHGSSWLSLFLEYMGQSKYSHVGIILKNPSFINESLKDGLYLWDASYSYTPEVENHKIDDILPLYKNHSIYVRKVSVDRNIDFEKQIKSIHEEVHSKPYNIHLIDWIVAKLNIIYPFHYFSWWKQTDRFWCSSLVAFIYYRLGWISDVNWSLVAPRDFSSVESSQLSFSVIISDEEELN